MIHSPRYQKVKTEITPYKLYSLPESLSFLQNNNLEKLKNIKASFTLNWKNQKQKTLLRTKIILPHSLPPKGKVAVVKDDLPTEAANRLAKNKGVELLSAEELNQRITTETGNKIKKRSQWGFEKLVIHPQSEKKFRLLKKLPSNVLLSENIEEEVKKFQKGEREIRTDKGGSIHILIGKTDFTTEQLTQNYQTIYDKINSLKHAKWKGVLIKKITLSTTMGPGVRIYT